MFDANPVTESIPNGLDRVRALGPSLLRIVLGLLFALIGYTKFNNDPRSEWVAIFQQIGLGQWFRYLTGGLQIVGGILLLFRQSATVGAAMLGSTMIGAAFVDAFVVHIPFFFIPL